MENDIINAAEVLGKGGLILYPTDTIWGIGCDATNEKAVEKIYALKRRETGKSLLVLLDDASKLNRFVSNIPDIAFTLIEVSDKPLTIIFDGAQNLAENVMASDGSIGIRIVKDEFCRRLLRKFGKPVVSTSANYSGIKWPSQFKEIDKGLIGKVDYVVSWGQNLPGHSKPSGIIKLGSNGEVKVIRE